MWALIEQLARSRPAEPRVGEPFMRLEDLVEFLEEHEVFPKLRKLFVAISGTESIAKYRAPIGFECEFPCFTFVEEIEAGLLAEAKQMATELADADVLPEWALEIDDEPDELGQVLGWLIEAAKKKKSLCLVLTGDL